MANTKIIITGADMATGGWIVSGLPDDPLFDLDGWIAMLCEPAYTTVPGEPTVAGDYQYMDPVIVDRKAKIINGTYGIITIAHIGHALVLYNPFLNYEFVGDQTQAPLFTGKGAGGTWRSSYAINGGIYKHSDGRYIWLMPGYDGTKYQIGYFESTDMLNWTVGNNDTPVITPDMIDDCFGVHQTGTIKRGGKLDLYCTVVCLRASDHSKNVTRIMYFDEDLTTFEFSDSLLDETVSLGCLGSSVIKTGGYYHMIYLYGEASAPDREIRVAKSLALEGPYVDYQTIVSGVTANDGQAWSYDVANMSIFKTGSRVWGLFGGQSQWAGSGNRGNQYFCLLNFDEDTETWSVDRRGPVIMNPAYFKNITENVDYEWCSDHCGGYPALFIDGKNVYLTVSMKGTIYQPALLKLKNVRV